MIEQHGERRMRINALRKADVLPKEIRRLADQEIATVPRDSSITSLKRRYKLHVKCNLYGLIISGKTKKLLMCIWRKIKDISISFVLFRGIVEYLIHIIIVSLFPVRFSLQKVLCPIVWCYVLYRCTVSGRHRGIFHQFRMSRMVWRMEADYNKVCGAERAKWMYGMHLKP